MKPLHPLSFSSSPSFALISVLALVSLAALTATAFLASARLERQATMPLTQTTLLEMALNSGCNAAKEMLDYAPSKHFNFVTTYWRGAGVSDWTNELGYLLSGAVQSTSIKTSTIVKYYCCFSTATMTNLGTNASSTIVVSNNITNQGTFLSQMTAFMNSQTNFASGQSTNIPLLGDTPTSRHTSPPVGWVYINQDVRVKPGQTNTTNVPVTRFAFYVQDLSSMIDAERMGGLTNGTPYRESTALPANYKQGTNPAEISLTNLTGTALTNAAKVSTFTASTNRIKYLSPGMLVLANVGGLNTNDLRYVTTGLRHWTNAYERIPVGLGYSNSWSNKYNLSNSANLNVANISAVISNNLTNFINRAGGMNGNTYVSNIAANIVDYVDTDGTPTTVGTYGTPNYSQGVDSYPWVNEVATRVTVQSYNAGSSQLVLNMRGFAELWNLSDKSFTGPITLTMQENDFIQAESGSAVTAANTPLITSGTLTANINILPMEFKVVEVFANLVTLNVPQPTGIATKYVTWPTASTNSTFELKIGGATVQKPLGGLARRVDISKTLTGNSDCLDLTTPALMESGANSRKIYRGNPLTHTNLTSFDFMNEGDPRMTPFRIIGTSTSHTWATYENGASYFMGNGRSSFGGWNTNSSLPQLSLTNLLESSYALTPGNMPTGPVNANGIFAVLPTSVVPIAPEPTKALQKLNNTGTFSNIFELGNIFDPMQWSFSSAVQPGGSIPATALATGSAPRRGGGTTLRIGRAEHPLFAWTNLAVGGVATPNMMMSSAALLDIFSSADQFDESGQINLNTAPAPVLRALAGGILLTNDPALINNLSANAPSHPVPPGVTEAFAQGVMRFRAKYPFYSPSQLAFIGTDPTWPNTTTWPANAVFGNTNPIALSTAPGNTFGGSTRINVNEWNDRAAEEWFAKIFKLSTTYSRNFRVYVIAQKATNSASGNIGVGPVVRKYYNVVTRQNTDAATDVPPASASIFTAFESSY
jgi:hypothetical protein